MKAFHSNWTAPFRIQHPNTPYAIEPFALLTTMLSALQWQKLGHSIAMLTDTTAAQYYEQLGITSVWNDGLQVVLDTVPAIINPRIYWAAGKLFALQTMQTPCIMLDTDFIVWRDLKPLCQHTDIAVIHQEPIVPSIYPDASQFKIQDTQFLSKWDWSVSPCNTALTYFGDISFKQYYTEQAIHFMCSTPQADNSLTYMVFAEQRMLSMCAAAKQKKLTVFSDLSTLFGGSQRAFTHVWGFKQQMRDNPAMYTAFCKRCAARLQADFPDFAEIARAIPALSIFFQT